MCMDQSPNAFHAPTPLPATAATYPSLLCCPLLLATSSNAAAPWLSAAATHWPPVAGAHGDPWGQPRAGGADRQLLDHWRRQLCARWELLQRELEQLHALHEEQGALIAHLEGLEEQPPAGSDRAALGLGFSFPPVAHHEHAAAAMQQQHAQEACAAAAAAPHAAQSQAAAAASSAPGFTRAAAGTTPAATMATRRPEPWSG